MGQSRLPRVFKECLFQVFLAEEFEAVTVGAEYLHQPWVENRPECTERATFQLLFEYAPHHRGQRRREHLGHIDQDIDQVVSDFNSNHDQQSTS